MNKKTRAPKKKTGKFTQTSINFLTPILSGLQTHTLRTEKDRSVSWIVNRLAEKFLEGEIVIE